MTRRRIALFSILMLIEALCAALPAAAQLVYATDSYGHSLWVIDGSRNPPAVTDTISLPPSSPGPTVVSPDGKFTYVVNSCLGRKRQFRAAVDLGSKAVLATMLHTLPTTLESGHFAFDYKCILQPRDAPLRFAKRRSEQDSG